MAVVGFFIFVALSSPIWAAQDVEIALFVSLSGWGVDAGTMSRDGAVLAAEDVNILGGIKALGGGKNEAGCGRYDQHICPRPKCR